jgi:hypothetical protein
MNYTITLTETEKLAMEYIAYDPQEWVENLMKERSRIAIDEIVKLAVNKFLELGQPTPATKEEIVNAAYSNGWIKTAKEQSEIQTNNLID